jgi:hypothetical protein
MAPSCGNVARFRTRGNYGSSGRLPGTLFDGLLPRATAARMARAFNCEQLCRRRDKSPLSMRPTLRRVFTRSRSFPSPARLDRAVCTRGISRGEVPTTPSKSALASETGETAIRTATGTPRPTITSVGREAPQHGEANGRIPVEARLAVSPSSATEMSDTRPSPFKPVGRLPDIGERIAERFVVRIPAAPPGSPRERRRFPSF